MDNNPKLAPTSNYDVGTKRFLPFWREKGSVGVLIPIPSCFLDLEVQIQKNRPPSLKRKEKTRTVTLTDANCTQHLCSHYCSLQYMTHRGNVGKLTMSIYQNKRIPQQEEYTSLGPGDKKKKKSFHPHPYLYLNRMQDIHNTRNRNFSHNYHF